jgi:dolichol-phosphate mannosyltransferase
MDISIIIPCYNNAKCIESLYYDIISHIQTLGSDYEIIFIDDGSPQEDYKIINEIASKHKQCKLIKLIRNFGQHNAISAGLRVCKGDWVVVMDADFEDDPKYIPELYKKAQEGNDIVFARRISRTHSLIKRAESKVFHILFYLLTGMKTDSTVGNYGIFSRTVVNALNQMNEQFRGFGLLIKWLGFKCVYLNVEHGKRYEGKTSYNFHKGLILAFNSIIAFSQRPLKISVIFGFIITIISFIIACIFVLRWLLGKVAIVGWTSIVLSIWLIGGLNIIILGIVGLYIGKIFEETKQRPHYIIDYMVNIDET